MNASIVHERRFHRLVLATAVLLASGCGNHAGSGTAATATLGASATAPASPAPAAAAQVDAAVHSPAPATAASPPIYSSDPDNATPLPALQIQGAGAGKTETRYFAFDATAAGTVVVTATAKNSPSGATQALGFALYDTQANRLCFDAHGNTTVDKTVTLNCAIDKPQHLLLRLDLSPETINYSVELSGPIALPAPTVAAASSAVAGAGSTDIDEPTHLAGNRVKAEGSGKAVSYYYAFNAGPGTITLTGDGSNTSAAVTNALRLGLYTLRSERLCELNLGNTTLEKRQVTSCKIDKRKPVILRADLSPETVSFRARFDGPYDFEPFTPPAVITIALDSSVLFDTGKSELKPEARQQLHEAAERVKKFAGAAVVIGGHTDNVGSAASNERLSLGRALAVKDYLVRNEGLDSAALATQGFGSKQPVADNGSDAGRARNRRVDVVITPKAK